MQQFSLSTPDGEHLGFMIMLADDEQTNQSGQLAIRLSNFTHFPQLHDWEKEASLCWTVVNDKVQVRDSNNVLRGTIHQQWLSIGTERFLLNDLLGAL